MFGRCKGEAELLLRAAVRRDKRKKRFWEGMTCAGREAWVNRLSRSRRRATRHTLMQGGSKHLSRAVERVEETQELAAELFGKQDVSLAWRDIVSP